MGMQSIDDAAAELRARWPGVTIQSTIGGKIEVTLGAAERTRLTLWQYPVDGTWRWLWACDATYREHTAETGEHRTVAAAVEAGLRGLMASFRARAEAMAEQVGRLLAPAEQGEP